MLGPISLQNKSTDVLVLVYIINNIFFACHYEMRTRTVEKVRILIADDAVKSVKESVASGVLFGNIGNTLIHPHG